MGPSDLNANNWTPGKKNEKGEQKSISQIWFKNYRPVDSESMISPK